MLAEKTDELFEWMARQGRIDGDVADAEISEQARWTYFYIFNIDPYNFRYPDSAIPTDRMMYRPD
eukprot:7185149-Lingulodinium_polyedra.AAC.1